MYTCSCIISSESIVNPVISAGAVSYSTFTGKAKPINEMRIKIPADDKVASAMVEELGAVIEDAKAGKFEAIDVA